MRHPPAPLLQEYGDLLARNAPPGPVLDLACGDGRNGLFLARLGRNVLFCDRSEEALEKVREAAALFRSKISTCRCDLERGTDAPLHDAYYSGILVFRYLHRPLIPQLKRALTMGGLLFYETFTLYQPAFGRPHHPAHLLNPGELLKAFGDWQVIHYFEGVKQRPPRAIAQLVCRKPHRHVP